MIISPNCAHVLEITKFWFSFPNRSGPRFNIKMTSYQYRKSHCGDKTILRPSYLHNGVSYTGKTTSLYWIGALKAIIHLTMHVVLVSSCNVTSVDWVCGTDLKEETALRWRHNELDGVSDHQPHDCLLNRLFGRRSKKTSKLRVTGLCAGNSPGTGEFPAQKASNAENVSIWWRHHEEETDMLIE